MHGSVQFSHSVMSNSLRPHGLQHTRPPCPLPIPRDYSNSCPLIPWCHPTTSSSVVPFSSHLQSFPASGSFQMSQLFTSEHGALGQRKKLFYLYSLFDLASLFPGGSDGKVSAYNAGDPGSIPGWGKILWRRKWQPTPVLLPGKSHERSPVGYSPWGLTKSDTTEWLYFLLAHVVKNLPAMRETQVRSLRREDPLEKGMATHSSILVWRIPWTKEPGKLQSMGLQRVRHDWASNIYQFSVTQKGLRNKDNSLTIQC